MLVLTVDRSGKGLCRKEREDGSNEESAHGKGVSIVRWGLKEGKVL